jgi:hypothetical protein
MPQAVSKAQQRFFGLVRAVQKGDVPANKVTSNVRQAAKDTSPEDVEDIASKDTTGLPEKSPNSPVADDSDSDKSKKVDDSMIMNDDIQQEEQGINFYEIVAKYNEYGTILKNKHTLSELGQQLADIAEYAEHTLTNEMDDWFDKHTVARNIKEMRSYAKEFQKIAMEADSHNMRMKALYDDMGRVLERYFDIMDSDDGAESVVANETDESPDETSGSHPEKYNTVMSKSREMANKWDDKLAGRPEPTRNPSKSASDHAARMARVLSPTLDYKKKSEAKGFSSPDYTISKDWDAVQSRQSADAERIRKQKEYDNQVRAAQSKRDAANPEATKKRDDDVIRSLQHSEGTQSDSYEQQMFERIRRLARHKLKGENLALFDTLEPAKQIKLAWRIIR